MVTRSGLVDWDHFLNDMVPRARIDALTVIMCHMWGHARLLWWLSFADDSGNLGVAIVDGHTMLEAVTRARQLNCNPGGEVVAIPVDPDMVPVGFRERLWTRDQLEYIGLA